MDATSSNIARELGPALEALPLFPLPQTVLFPGALLPLHVFEPRYRAMVKDCLATHRAMAVVLIRDHGDRAENRHPAIESVAGLGVIVDHAELPDGRFNILLRGRARVRLEELPFVPPYRRAHATLMATPVEEEPPARDVAALLASAALFAADIRARDAEFDFQIPAHTPAGAAADLAAHHLILDARERQALLEMTNVCARIRRATEALALQHAALHGTAGGALN
jgi:Lon protease-like protein